MHRFASLKSLTAIAGAACISITGTAQTPTPTGTTPAASSETTAQPIAPKRMRAISSEVAAALAAAAPKYTPPAPKPEPKPEEEKPDLREIDKPKNGIVRLPKYIVREPKPPVFTERSIHTEKGLTDIAMKRYITETDRVLNFVRIPFLTQTTEARAMAMYAEDERLKNMSDLADAARNASKSDPAAGAYIRKESQNTYLRSSDFGWNGGGPK